MTRSEGDRFCIVETYKSVGVVMSDIMPADVAFGVTVATGMNPTVLAEDDLRVDKSNRNAFSALLESWLPWTGVPSPDSMIQRFLFDGLSVGYTYILEMKKEGKKSGTNIIIPIHVTGNSSWDDGGL